MDNLFNMLQQFIMFNNNFKGDPKAKAEELLSTGQMTQEQFQQLKPKADQIYSMFNGFIK